MANHLDCSYYNVWARTDLPEHEKSRLREFTPLATFYRSVLNACSLLAQQKANLKLSASQPGKSLLNRLNKPSNAGKAASPNPNANNSRSKGTPVQDKVARAKAKANSSNKMEVDEPSRKSKERSVPKVAPKTQADLDEEMRAYDRQRRFA